VDEKFGYYNLSSNKKLRFELVEVMKVVVVVVVAAVVVF